MAFIRALYLDKDNAKFREVTLVRKERVTDIDKVPVMDIWGDIGENNVFTGFLASAVYFNMIPLCVDDGEEVVLNLMRVLFGVCAQSERDVFNGRCIRF